MNEAHEMTGFSKDQLHLLLLHLRVPQVMISCRQYKFTGEEALLHYSYWNRVGGTKVQMGTNKFGGDPRRFTYSIRLMTDHLYKNFYHKTSGDSIRMWIPHIHTFRYAIWRKLMDGLTVEEGANGTNLVSINIPFNSFRIFGFLDDTGFKTTSPGNERRRVFGFIDDIQRAFYSAYFAGHGIKIQVLSLPNRMVGLVYLGSWRESDSGLLNMSGLDSYLSRLFSEFNMHLPDAHGQLPAVYGDGIFPQLSTIVARYQNEEDGHDDVHRRINTCMASVRESIEHLFSIHYHIFALFHDPARFRLLVSGVEVTRMIFNSFLLLNLYICFNESANSDSIVRPPSIQEYLPLHEDIPMAPEISDMDLGAVFNYNYHVSD